jgi:hypothetical protein
LRKQLGHSRLQVQVEIGQDQLVYRPYGPQETFTYLAKKQPLLADLKARLQLDWDY